MSRSKAKGTAAETAVARWLRENGFPHAERRALNGKLDRGDIAGVLQTVLEVKSCARQEMPAWLREAAVEAERDGARWHAVITKPRGVGDTRVGEWHAVLPLHVLADLISEALR